jgi:hypothetical protein
MLIRLIDCQMCINGGYVCEGYSTRLHWKTTVNDKSRSAPSASALNGDGPQMAGPMSPGGQLDQRWPGYRKCRLSFIGFNLCAGRQSSLYANWIPEDPIIATSTTPLERRYLRHYLAYRLPPSGSTLTPSHVCRVTPAIDEPSNSLRNVVLPMAATDPALLNTILAVSHPPTTPEPH